MGGPSERPKLEAKVRGHVRPWEAEVGGRGGRLRESKVGGCRRPKWEAMGV